jgi:hypothetical protein
MPSVAFLQAVCLTYRITLSIQPVEYLKQPGFVAESNSLWFDFRKLRYAISQLAAPNPDFP